MTDQTPIGDLLRSAMPRHSAPAELRRWAEEQARAMDDAKPVDIARSRVPVRRGWRPLGMAAGLLLAAALGWAGHGVAGRSMESSGGERQLASELVDGHVRSLMLDHLVDVQSSDHHTVKPWFLGKADLAPKVPELADAGFPLIGGRMDFVGGRATPVIVYQRRKHFISLYMWKAARESASPNGSSAGVEGGFHVLSWVVDGMSYSAVSDVGEADLEQFREAYSAAP